MGAVCLVRVRVGLEVGRDGAEEEEGGEEEVALRSMAGE